MKITVEQLEGSQLKPLYQDDSQLGFGRIFTDRMFSMRFVNNAWNEARIEKYRSFTLDPSSCVFHYSQEIFEGLKAYAAPDGRILLFRPDQNARRMNRSAERLVMPTIPEEDIIQAIEELVLAEKRWLPKQPGTSIYIRPTMIATEAFLGVHPSAEYIFYVILSPVGAYYKGGFKPISLYVEDTYVRANVGGVGDIKTGGNYAASLMAGYRAQQKGFSQVLWLDGRERKYIEEVGAMNMFFVYGKKLVTPKLTGSILPGITRASVLELARYLGLETEERIISIDDVIDGISSGEVTEAFGSGTAAVISPVGSLYYKEKDFVINHNEVGSVTQTLYDKLVNIQYGREEDPFGWVREIGRY
ncbi:branched chain amino acid aminotransferase apoenzyme [Desulforamulus reducens MI-1]|uniref:Branched-chain-amino-acid aminotransferase n=1 Tax=Desulforamulus reducens (strain ATCC BAA-1160 / DSM 100696 / MI-1) TaxID=349161 RepID=A4J6F8_DESRM|nr:branched-chain amino acid aminotransferase [Desulforamulus reducens]ABO50661.1 branched chain amino acid aminotransferase apoenzyme [Desulforamulus reducens MI-1]